MLAVLPQGGAFIGCLVCGLLCFACALPRQLVFLSRFIGVASLCTLFTTPLCVTFFALYGTRQHAADAADATLSSAATAASTGIHWLWNPRSDCVSKMLAVLHMTFAFLGQPSVPTLISDMRDPRDFPRALAGSLAAQTAAFSAYGVGCYRVVGSAAMTSPVFRALPTAATGISVALLMVPATVGQAALFGSLLARFLWDSLGFDRWVPPLHGESDGIRSAGWWKRHGSWTAMNGESAPLSATPFILSCLFILSR